MQRRPLIGIDGEGVLEHGHSAHILPLFRRQDAVWLFEPPEMLAERAEGADSEFWERSAFADVYLTRHTQRENCHETSRQSSGEDSYTLYGVGSRRVNHSILVDAARRCYEASI
jgi:hypothetical protein